MNEKEVIKKSKYLSLILRHNPGLIQLELDKNGWADVKDLLDKSKGRIHLNIKELSFVVANDNKKRFSFNKDKTKIRANQGHSLKHVDLELKPITPPTYLYHGTVARFIVSIKEKGLQKMNRQYVHLSKDPKIATQVGSRRGKPIVLSVQAIEMHKKGHLFFLSDNGVWLTDTVPIKYIEFND